MRSNRLALVILPIALLVLVWAVPYNHFMAKDTKAVSKDAAAEESKAKGLEAQVKVGEDAKAREAQNLEQLQKIRQALPNVPEEFIAPAIRALSDKATARGVTLTLQDQVQPVLGGTATPAAGADANGTPANPDAGKSFSVKLKVSGPLDGVLGFISDMPATQRFFVNGVAIKGDRSEDFGKEGNSQVAADLDLRAYVAASASVTG